MFNAPPLAPSIAVQTWSCSSQPDVIVWTGPPLDEQSLKHFLKRIPNAASQSLWKLELQRLIACNTIFTDTPQTVTFRIYSTLAKLQCLQELSFSTNCEIFEHQQCIHMYIWSQALILALPKLQNLKELTLVNYELRQDLQSILDNTPKTLRILRLSDLHLDNCFAKCHMPSGLQELDLSQSYLNNEFPRELPQTLRKLKLNGCRLDDGCIEQLRMLLLNINLIELELEGDYLTDLFLEELEDYFKIVHLNLLNLAYNEFRFEGIKSLFYCWQR